MGIETVLCIIGGIVGFFVGGFLGFIDTRSELRDFAEFARRDDIAENDAPETQTDYKAEGDHLRVLLKTATERADRLAAMNQGLTEDLAALKAYNPEEVEERLKKIREIRADEERQKAEKELQMLLFHMAAAAQMSMPYGGIANSCCSLADQQRINWR